MSDSKADAAFDDLLARSGVTLTQADLAKVRELARAMGEAASVVNQPLDPSVPPATELRLFGARRP